MAGVSRSSTVCIGWLMRTHKIGYDEAFRCVCSKRVSHAHQRPHAAACPAPHRCRRVHAVRPWICPNSGFKLQVRNGRV